MRTRLAGDRKRPTGGQHPPRQDLSKPFRRAPASGCTVPVAGRSASAGCFRCQFVAASLVSLMLTSAYAAEQRHPARFLGADSRLVWVDGAASASQQMSPAKRLESGLKSQVPIRGSPAGKTSARKALGVAGFAVMAPAADWTPLANKWARSAPANQPAFRQRPRQAPEALLAEMQLARAAPVARLQQRSPAAESPAAAAVETKDCALILQRTFVKRAVSNQIEADEAGGAAPAGATLETLEPTGQTERLCVEYEHVNLAIATAKQLLRFDDNDTQIQAAVQSIEPEPAQIAQLGELNQKVTELLAREFDLSADEIVNGLPLIDMRRTDFWPLCPLMVRPLACDPAGRFRSFTGHCNNLAQPSWGAAQTPFVRFLAPAHPDGIHLERVSALDGGPLPAPRLVTSTVHRDHDQPSGDLTLLVMVWGQMIDHDVALAAPPRVNGMDFNCCKTAHPNCKPIEIPANDPLYSRFGQRCMDFKRSLAGLRPNCALGPRAHINTITSTIDANTIYGSTRRIADLLRTFEGGQLRMQPVFRAQGLKPLLPEQLIEPDLDCFDRRDGRFCFLAGDERVNEQPTLTALHTVYARDHNRLAAELGRLNPHWDDDRLYHETRHIEAAVVQHLLVSEYLPLLIGPELMAAHNLTEQPAGRYWRGYEARVTPAISHAFSAAAFRQGHTFIQGQLRLHDSETHAELGRVALRELFKRPWHYYQPGRLDQVLAGIVDTPAQTYDPFITEEISGHLFEETGAGFGMDLPAINLARGREQGAPGYNAHREWCGLPRLRTFDELVPLMANRSARQYARLYRHVDDIDLWSAGVSERRLPGAQVGPTFACIIARQFANVKRGDRFWFERGPGEPGSFTPDQLREIKKTSQARVICRNSDRMRTIQRHALRLAHPIRNPRVPCDQIPDLDLRFWREDPARPGEFYGEL